MIDTWHLVNSFLTPATLFLLLNLVVATIFLSSRHHQKSHQPDPLGTPFSGAYHFPLLRTTSPVLERLRSFTLHRFRSGEIPTDHVCSSPTRASILNPIPTEAEPHPMSIGSNTDYGEVTAAPSPPPLVRTSSILDRLKSINLYRFRSGEIQTEEVETETTGTISEHQYGRSRSESSRPVEKKKKMKKTVSVGDTDSDKIMVRQRMSFRGRDMVVEEEVDARADDFINKFKEQLKIQRLNSILNYKDMLNRGS